MVSRRRGRGECSHSSTIQVITNGLERVVCEDCSHVSVRYESMISGDIDRSMFIRKADHSHSEPPQKTTGR